MFPSLHLFRNMGRQIVNESMNRISIALARVFLSVLSTQTVFSSEDPHPDTLRVMSYNTWYVFGARNDYVKADQRPDPKKWVKSQTPDVMALQELTNIKPEKLEEFAAAWGHQHSSLLKTSGFSVGLTSRWPIETIEKGLKEMHHGFLHAKTNGVHYFLVHLSPFKWAVRQREAKLLIRKINPLLKKGEEVIVLGDFNAVSKEDKKWIESAKNVERLQSKKESDAKHGHVQNLKDDKWDYGTMDIFFNGGLKDTATGKLAESFEARLSIPTGVWNKNTNYKAPAIGHRIDFILASQSLQKKVKLCKIITKGDVNRISDHYPVITDFTQ